jgi:hypothetical protein
VTPPLTPAEVHALLHAPSLEDRAETLARRLAAIAADLDAGRDVELTAADLEAWADIFAALSSALHARGGGDAS